MMKLSVPLSISALFASLILLSSLSAHAQIAFNKSVFYDTAQSREVLGFDDTAPINVLSATQDSTSVSLKFFNRNGDFNYTYSGGRWTNLLPSNLVYDTPNHPSSPYVVALSGGKALISARRSMEYAIDNMYISDGLNAYSIGRNANIGSLDHRFAVIPAVSFVGNSIYGAISPDIDRHTSFLFEKHGNNPLELISSSPLTDPRYNFVIDGINQVFPSATGIAFFTQNANTCTLYEYRNGTVVPLFDSGTALFGDQIPIGVQKIQPSVRTQDAYLFQYTDYRGFDVGVALYQNGTFTKILEKGQQLPSNAGLVESINNSWLDNGEVVIQVRIDTGNFFSNEYALVYYSQGHLQVIDRYSSPYARFYPETALSGLYNHSFFVTDDYMKNDGSYGGMRVYRYSAVPESGTMIFLVVSMVSGVYLRRRSRRTTEPSFREIR